jgi:hypothetical protein
MSVEVSPATSGDVAEQPAAADGSAADGRTGRPDARVLVGTVALWLVAVALLVDAWREVVDPDGAAVAFGALAVATVLALVWYLDHCLFRPDPERIGLYLVGLGTTTAAVAAVAWLGAHDVLEFPSMRLLAVGVCLARPLVGAVQTSLRPRATWWQLLGAIVVWNVVLAVYVTFGTDLPSWGVLVWEGSDQGALIRQTHALVHGDFGTFTYQIGLSVLLAPGAVLAETAIGVPPLRETIGGAPNSVTHANLVNTLFVPIYAVVVMPAVIWGVAQAALRSVADRVTSARVAVGAVLTAVIVVGYTWLPPDHVPARHADLVPRRLLGLVFSMEPLGMLALAGAMLLLARRDDAWHAVPAGVVAGYMAMLSERFIPTVLLFIGLLLLMKAHRRRALIVAAVAFLAFLPQLLYFRFAYGGWLFPNRETQWVSQDKAAAWSEHTQARFGLAEGAEPSRMSLDYLATNGADMVQGHWPMLILLTVSLGVLCWRRPRQWPLWSFCAGHIVIVGLMSAVYINIVVTWRYNGIVLPAVALLVVAALWTVVTDVGLRMPQRHRAAHMTGDPTT